MSDPTMFPTATPPALRLDGGDFSADQFRLLANHVPALIATYDADTRRCLFANRQYATAFGRSEHDMVGLTFEEVIGEVAAREIQPHVDRVLQERVSVAYERRVVDREGRPRWLEVHLLPHIDGQGRPREVFVLISDISRHRLAETAVRESEERLATFMAASAEGIAFHHEGVITDANPPLLELTGYDLHEILGRHVMSFIAPADVPRVMAVWQARSETSYELNILHKDGHELPVEFIVRTMMRNGRRLRMTIVRDMRDRHAAQARIQHLAHHDTLTGLPNRGAFMERLDQLIGGTRDGDHRLALLFVDLDHFKRVNDSLGHLAGDALLKTVAERLSAGVRATDLVARFRGDAVRVLLPGALRAHDV